MINEYLKAGYPALCILPQEPHRTEQLINIHSIYFQDSFDTNRSAPVGRADLSIKFQ
jgi:hypothetical protein